MTDNKRAPRATETREETSRRKPWAPPSHLQAPDAPEGYVHRWIRTAMRGEEDVMNVTSKLREGWEPVRADEYPTFHAPVIDSGSYSGCRSGPNEGVTSFNADSKQSAKSCILRRTWVFRLTES